MFDQGGRMSLDDIISTVATDQNVNYWLLLGEGPRMERFMAGAICWLYDAYEQFYKAGGLSDTPWIEGARQYMRDDLVSNELPAGAAFELSLWLSRRIYQSDMPLFDFLTWTRFCRIFATLFVVGVDEAKMEHAVDNVIPGKPSPEILAEMLNPTSKKTIH